MERKGKTLKVLQDGHPRRMSDGKNAFRKMNAEQRAEFLSWACTIDPMAMIYAVEARPDLRA